MCDGGESAAGVLARAAAVLYRGRVDPRDDHLHALGEASVVKVDARKQWLRSDGRQHRGWYGHKVALLEQHPGV